MAYNYYQPQYSGNPYYNYGFQNLQQPQIQPQPQLQQPILYGKVVDGIDVVKAIDVPVGSNYILPKADGTTIFSKGWNPDGTTFVKEYKLSDSIKEEIHTINWEEKLNELIDSIDEINKKIDKLKSSSTSKKRKIDEEEDEDE